MFATPSPPCGTEVNVAYVIQNFCLKAQSPNALQIPSGGGGGGGVERVSKFVQQ